MSVKNVKIRFNLSKKNDRKAYEYLQNAEVSYSKAVISAICGYIELSERTATEVAFLERIITTIKEETAKVNPLGGLLQLVQQPPAQIPAEKENNAESKAQLSDLERERKTLSNRIRRPKSPEDENRNKERRKEISNQMKPVRERLRRAEKILEKSPHLCELLKQEHELERKARARYLDRSR